MNRDPDDQSLADPAIGQADESATPAQEKVAPVARGLRSPTLSERLSWTPRQRRGMAVLLTLVLGILAWRAFRDPSHISDPQPVKPARFAELADRLDPNTATWAELAAIPALGEKRAKAIIDHRDDWKKRHPGELPYQQAVDLAAVSGIGATMIEQMKPHLTFPPNPTSVPTP